MRRGRVRQPRGFEQFYGYTMEQAFVNYVPEDLQAAVPATDGAHAVDNGAERRRRTRHQSRNTNPCQPCQIAKRRVCSDPHTD